MIVSNHTIDGEWSETAPTEAGFYFVRRNFMTRIRCVEVYRVRGKWWMSGAWSYQGPIEDSGFQLLWWTVGLEKPPLDRD